MPDSTDRIFSLTRDCAKVVCKIFDAIGVGRIRKRSMCKQGRVYTLTFATLTVWQRRDKGLLLPSSLSAVCPVLFSHDGNIVLRSESARKKGKWQKCCHVFYKNL